MKRLSYIYKITNSINARFYIGIHKCKGSVEVSDDKYMGSGKAIKLAQKKYGLENFTKEILLFFPNFEEALQYEKETVNPKFLEENPLCYNIHPGGRGGSIPGKNHPCYNKKRPEHSALLMALGDKHWTKQPQYKIENSIRMKAYWGDSDAKDAQSLRAIKRFENPEQREALSNCKKEWWAIPENKAKMSGTNHRLFNKKRSAGTLEKMRCFRPSICGENNPSKRPEVRALLSGQNNPMSKTNIERRRIEKHGVSQCRV